MRRLSCLFLVAGLLLLPMPRRAAGEFRLEPGFTLLFNGKNLDGWKEASGKKEALDGKTEAYKGRFKVTEGRLVYDPAVKGDLYIETAREFGKDVHIKFDFKPGPKCNNDLFLRGTKFDIVPGNKENKNVKEGEWHTLEIIVTGDKIEHKINGETARTSKAGTKATTRWPVANIGVGQQLNTGVASYIQQTQGAIGYVEYAFAQKSRFNNVALKNASGAFVAPTLDSIKAAGAQATNLSAANFNIVNGAGAGTYPLANFSWALLYQKQASTDVGIVLGKLFDWVTTTGQQQANPLGYAPMPDNAVSLAHTTLLTLQTASGQPLFG